MKQKFSYNHINATFGNMLLCAVFLHKILNMNKTVNQKLKETFFAETGIKWYDKSLINYANWLEDKVVALAWHEDKPNKERALSFNRWLFENDIVPNSSFLWFQTTAERAQIRFFELDFLYDVFATGKPFNASITRTDRQPIKRR